MRLDYLDRRAFLGSLAALASRPGFANAGAGPRFGAHTSQGKAMLVVYRDAVAAMMDKSRFPEGDPRSWMFQWYIHAVRGDRSKASEIKRAYPAAGPAEQLARATWDTCEAHHVSSRGQDYFLPWHRMYLRCFEEIVRDVTKRADFTLPYWDYTDAAHRGLPEEFRRKDDPAWKSLYRPDRNGFANVGSPIDQSGMSIDLEAMTARYYSDTSSEAGFANNIDGLLHGAVHVSVGNAKGMGRVPWAANDPIFWLHHCNIDRIWASWVKLGGGDPPASTLNEAFNFVDGQGKATQLKVSDVVSVSTVNYDTYIDKRPPGSPPFPGGGPVLTAGGLRFATREALPLQAKAKVADLRRETGTGPLFTSGAGLKAVEPETPLYVILDGISGDAASEDSKYEVHAVFGNQLPKLGSPESFVGTLCLFGVGGHGQHAGHAPALRRKVSFLVTGAARAVLQAQDSNPRVVLIPSGGVAGRAQVARVSLVTG